MLSAVHAGVRAPALVEVRADLVGAGLGLLLVRERLTGALLLIAFAALLALGAPRRPLRCPWGRRNWRRLLRAVLEVRLDSAIVHDLLGGLDAGELEDGLLPHFLVPELPGLDCEGEDAVPGEVWLEDERVAILT